MFNPFIRVLGLSPKVDNTPPTGAFIRICPDKFYACYPLPSLFSYYTSNRHGYATEIKKAYSGICFYLIGTGA